MHNRLAQAMDAAADEDSPVKGSALMPDELSEEPQRSEGVRKSAYDEDDEEDDYYTEDQSDGTEVGSWALDGAAALCGSCTPMRPCTLLNLATCSGLCMQADGQVNGLAHLDNASTETPEGINVQPVVDDQQQSFPDKYAVVTLLRSGVDLPPDEAVHLGCHPESTQPGEAPQDGVHNCMRVSFAMLHCGTMANEIEFCHTLVQWPYLTEFSLISAIISIFLPSWGHPAAGPEAGLRLMALPWMYFNLVMRDSQLFIPVLSPRLKYLEFGWRAASADEEVLLTAEKLQELFASAAADDVTWRREPGRMSRQPSPGQPMRARGNTDGGGGGGGGGAGGDYALQQYTLSQGITWGGSMRRIVHEDEELPRLEEMGLVLTMSALRVGSFAGK